MINSLLDFYDRDKYSLNDLKIIFKYVQKPDSFRFNQLVTHGYRDANVRCRDSLQTIITKEYVSGTLCGHLDWREYYLYHSLEEQDFYLFPKRSLKDLDQDLKELHSNFHILNKNRLSFTPIKASDFYQNLSSKDQEILNLLSRFVYDMTQISEDVTTLRHNLKQFLGFGECVHSNAIAFKEIAKEVLGTDPELYMSKDGLLYGIRYGQLLPFTEMSQIITNLTDEGPQLEYNVVYQLPTTLNLQNGVYSVGMVKNNPLAAIVKGQELYFRYLNQTSDPIQLDPDKFTVTELLIERDDELVSFKTLALEFAGQLLSSDIPHQPSISGLLAGAYYISFVSDNNNVTLNISSLPGNLTIKLLLQLMRAYGNAHTLEILDENQEVLEMVSREDLENIA